MELKDTVVFCQDDLITTSFSAFQDMRKCGKYCDLTIQIQDRTIRAHRMVLSAAIPFFDSVFRSSDESSNGEVMLEDLDPEALDILIDFVYTTKVEISTNNVQSLLLTAQLLQLHQVQEACIQFLSQRLQINNVLQVHDFAIRIKMPHLVENVNRFIKDNFKQFCQHEDFMSLSYSCLKAVISHDDLNVSDEETVFEAMIKWVKKSTSERHPVLPELLKEVRMIYIPSKYIFHAVAVEDLVRGSTPCRDLLDEVKNYHMMAEEKSLFPNLNISPRKSYSKKRNQCLYAVLQRGDTVYINRFDFVNGDWINLNTYSLNCFVHYAVCFNDNVYLLCQQTITTFDLKSRKWLTLESKHKNIYYFAAVLAHKNVIYCVGGNFDVIQPFSTVKNQWLPEVQLNTKRWCAGVAALENLIYITGGSTFDCLNTVAKYNTVTEKFSKVYHMLDSRRSHGCTAMNGKIYVCGGMTNHTEYLCTAEVYDPLVKKWNYISSMKIKRFNFSLLCKDNRLYAIGGYNILEGEKEMEIYDVQSDQWTSRILLPEEGYPNASYFFQSSII